MKKTASAERRGGKDRCSHSTKKPSVRSLSQGKLPCLRTEFPTKTAQRCMRQALSEASISATDQAEKEMPGNGLAWKLMAHRAMLEEMQKMIPGKQKGRNSNSVKSRLEIPQDSFVTGNKILELCLKCQSRCSKTFTLQNTHIEKSGNSIVKVTVCYAERTITTQTSKEKF